MHPKNQLIDQILNGLSSNYRKPNGDPIEISPKDRGNWMVTLQDLSEEALTHGLHTCLKELKFMPSIARFRECCEITREQKAQWNPDPEQKLLEGPQRERYVPEEGELRRKLDELMTEVQEKKVKPQPKRYPFTVSMGLSTSAWKQNQTLRGNSSPHLTDTPGRKEP
jgi:hypothetical protein